MRWLTLSVAVCALIVALVAFGDVRIGRNASAGTTWEFRKVTTSEVADTLITELDAACQVELAVVPEEGGYGASYAIAWACP